MLCLLSNEVTFLYWYLRYSASEYMARGTLLWLKVLYYDRVASEYIKKCITNV